MTRMTQEQFDGWWTNMAMFINTLQGAFYQTFPEGYLWDEDPVGIEPCYPGSAGDNPMRQIAKKLDDVMEMFDLMQVAMGLPPGEEPRYARYFKPEPEPEPEPEPDPGWPDVHNDDKS